LLGTQAGRPDLANFRLLADCSFLAIYVITIAEIA
jgi:hypothetical protein